jgi:hypothetical protein
MKIPGWGEPSILSRAVEDPIEATFDLGEDLKKQAPGLNLTVNLGIILTILLIISIIPKMLYFAITMVNVYLGNTELAGEITRRLVILVPSTIVILALSITGLLFIIQLKRFYKHIYTRYDSISDLKETGPEKKPGKKDRREGDGKHFINPIRAMLDLIEESSHQVHKIIRLLRFCGNIYNFLLGFLVASLVVDLLTGLRFLIVFYPFELYIVVIIILLVPLALMLNRSAEFFRYYDTRHHIIDNVRFGKIAEVPEGKNPLERLVAHLGQADPIIRAALKTDSASFKYDVKARTGSGEDYTFDAYLEGVNRIKPEPETVGVPGGSFSVYIKVFKRPITLSALERLKSAVEDDVRKSRGFPLRIIALQWEVEDLDDRVYEFVLENPVMVQNTMWHLQIVAEDGEVYSFIPQVAYEMEES